MPNSITPEHVELINKFELIISISLFTCHDWAITNLFIQTRHTYKTTCASSCTNSIVSLRGGCSLTRKWSSKMQLNTFRLERHQEPTVPPNMVSIYFHISVFANNTLSRLACRYLKAGLCSIWINRYWRNQPADGKAESQRKDRKAQVLATAKAAHTGFRRADRSG
jgi:hypothetical protein